MRAGIDSISINPDAAVFSRKLVASIEQRIMLEKTLGQVRVDQTKSWFSQKFLSLKEKVLDLIVKIRFQFFLRDES